MVAGTVITDVEWKKPNVNWGAASAGRRYMNAHHALLDLERAKVHVKNFRPQYLVLAGDMTQRPHLVKLMGLLRKVRRCLSVALCGCMCGCVWLYVWLCVAVCVWLCVRGCVWLW